MRSQINYFFGRLIYYFKNEIQNLNGFCAILIYHRVIDLLEDPQLLSVSPQNFDSQLKYLKSNHYRILSLDELVEKLHLGKKLPRKSIVITFDDGYSDNYQYALPILEQYTVPATIYVATDYVINNKEYWWDELEKIFLLSPSYKDLDIEIAGENYNKIIACFEDSFEAYKEIHPLLKNLPEDERENALNKLFRWANLSRNEVRHTHSALTVEQLKKMSKHSIIEIGAHTLTHPCLSYESLENQETQVKKCKEELERIIDKKVNSFSYPFGGINDFGEDTKEFVKSKYSSCTVNYPDLVTRDSDVYALPRFLVRNWNEKEFASFLDNVFYSRRGFLDVIKKVL